MHIRNCFFDSAVNFTSDTVDKTIGQRRHVFQLYKVGLNMICGNQFTRINLYYRYNFFAIKKLLLLGRYMNVWTFGVWNNSLMMLNIWDQFTFSNDVSKVTVMLIFCVLNDFKIGSLHISLLPLNKIFHPIIYFNLFYFIRNRNR